MVGHTSISTKDAGWRDKCGVWAKARQPFEVRDLESARFLFCQELCAEYGYMYEYHCRPPESVAQFKPL